MDIYNHLVENIQKDPARIHTTNSVKPIPEKKFFIPQDMRDIEKQRRYKEKRNKHSKQVVGFEQSHLIFQRPWNDLNKAQKMNRIIEYAKQNNLEKQPLLLALEKRKIKDISYDERQGMIIELALKE